MFRISLPDIASKLQLDSAEDAEYIVSKVRDTLFVGLVNYLINATSVATLLPVACALLGASSIYTIPYIKVCCFYYRQYGMV